MKPMILSLLLLFSHAAFAELHISAKAAISTISGIIPEAGLTGNGCSVQKIVDEYGNLIIAVWSEADKELYLTTYSGTGIVKMTNLEDSQSKWLSFVWRAEPNYTVGVLKRPDNTWDIRVEGEREVPVCTGIRR